MKKLVFIISISFIVSCKQQRYVSDLSGPISKGSVCHIAVVADLDVSQNKISATATDSIYNIPLEELKKMAIFKACKASNSDELVAPVFEAGIVISHGIGMLKVTVTGYPATYKNFRSIKKEDIDLLQPIKTMPVK